MSEPYISKLKYQIIADYPDNKYPIGTILIPNRYDGVIDGSFVTEDKNDRSFVFIKNISDYPHLFKLIINE
jgi:hypothetical protein